MLYVFWINIACVPDGENVDLDKKKKKKGCYEKGMRKKAMRLIKKKKRFVVFLYKNKIIMII